MLEIWISFVLLIGKYVILNFLCFNNLYVCKIVWCLICVVIMWLFLWWFVCVILISVKLLVFVLLFVNIILFGFVWMLCVYICFVLFIVWWVWCL